MSSDVNVMNPHPVSGCEIDKNIKNLTDLSVLFLYFLSSQKNASSGDDFFTFGADTSVRDQSMPWAGGSGCSQELS